MAPDKEDCTCPICMCIFIEPVTMPCKHSLCMPCYTQTVEKANLCCPICRLRISVWSRQASKRNSLVDKVKWDLIKKAFPEQVQNRLEGNESQDETLDDSDNYETCQRKLKELSKPGEIRQEYEAALQKLQHQLENEAKVAEEASVALIKSLQQEEEREKEKLEMQREELDRMDREIAEVLQKSSIEADSTKLAEPEPSLKPVSLPIVINKMQTKTSTSGSTKGKKKQLKQPASNTLTLTTFFSPVHRGDDALSPSSDLRYQRECSLVDSDSCSSDSRSFYNYIPDSFSPKFSPHPSTSREPSVNSCFVKVCRWDRHSEKTQVPLQITAISELKKKAAEFHNTEQPILRSEYEDRFTTHHTGPEIVSGAHNTTATKYAENVEKHNTLATSCTEKVQKHNSLASSCTEKVDKYNSLASSCTEKVQKHNSLASSCTEKVDKYNTSASSSGETICHLNNASKIQPLHTISQSNPQIKCTRKLPEQVIPSVVAEIENSSTCDLFNNSSPGLDLSTLLQTSNPDYRTLNYQTKDQYFQESNMQNINNVCNSSSHNGSSVSNKTTTEIGKDGKIAQHSDYVVNQIATESLLLKSKLNPSFQTRGMFSESCQVMNVGVASRRKSIDCDSEVDDDEFICAFSESGDKNEMKENDNTENECQKRDNTENECQKRDNTENEYQKRDNTENKCQKRDNTENECQKRDNTENECQKRDNTENECQERDNTENEYQKRDNTENEYQKRDNTENNLQERKNTENGMMKRNNNEKRVIISSGFMKEKIINNNFKMRITESSNYETGKVIRSYSELESREISNTTTDLINDSDNSFNDSKPDVISFDKQLAASCDDSSSDTTHENYERTGKSFENIFSKSRPNNSGKIESVRAACLSGVACEKKNGRVKTSSSQCRDVKSLKTVRSKSLVPTKAFKNKNSSHSTQKSKSSTASLMKRDNSTLLVSIDRWCVHNNRKVEEGISLGFGVDKTETCVKNNMLNENEDFIVETIQMQEEIRGKRKEKKDSQSEFPCSTPKKLRRNDHTEMLKIDAGGLDVLCPQDSGDTEMTQEQKDHLLALELQKMYTQLDKQRIAVDRSKGSKDQYQFRKNRK